MSRSFTAGIRVIDKVAMFLLGAINNLPYVVGVASANIIAGSEPTYLGLVLWANTLSGLFARFINTGLAAKSVPYTVNFTINCCAMLGGLLGCAFAPNFWVSLVSVFFIGFSSSFGESVLLCYLAIKRKQSLLTFWSIHDVRQNVKYFLHFYRSLCGKGPAAGSRNAVFSPFCPCRQPQKSPAAYKAAG